MTRKIIIAGFGGQGIILSGKLLAYCAMIENKEVTHIPSYGPEMRGGTCNCSVIISDEPIASPIIINSDITLIMNQQSKNKFEEKCKKDSIIFINSSLIEEKVKRKDLKAYYVDATNLAEKSGSVKSANMIMLGALAKATDIVKLNTLIDSLPKIISSRNKALIDINANALKKGHELF